MLATAQTTMALAIRAPGKAVNKEVSNLFTRYVYERPTIIVYQPAN